MNIFQIDSEALMTITRHAGAIIMDYYNSGEINLQHKADGSPVTAADKAAEKYIIAELAALYPDIKAIGEESYSDTTVSEILTGKEPFWLIDPLDGTKEFLQRTGDFTVNIALVAEGKPLAGLVYAPAKDILYIGSSKGAYKYAKGQKTRINATAFEGKRTLNAALSRSHSTPKESAFLESLQKEMPVDIIRAGSSLKFCMVADGSADFYFRDGRTMYWDSAAGHAVANAAGARVVEWPLGKELEYNKEVPENPSFLVARAELIGMCGVKE
jgi:3'(2'), 5'-bisphosphate nucleotidase